jgi:hypothetical protein
MELSGHRVDPFDKGPEFGVLLEQVSTRSVSAVFCCNNFKEFV